jgi:hypothetical protein
MLALECLHGASCPSPQANFFVTTIAQEGTIVPLMHLRTKAATIGDFYLLAKTAHLTPAVLCTRNESGLLHLVQRAFPQLFCLINKFFKTDFIKRREVLHRPQGRTLLATLYHSDGPLAVACGRRDFNLLHPPDLAQPPEDLAKRFLKSERRRSLNVDHMSIFGIDATT